jgi:hypothetical protein
MGNQQTIARCNFEDVQQLIHHNDGVLINTLRDTEQDCLIQNSVHSSNEIELINNLIKSNTSITIIIYGKNSADTSVHKKYEQLIQHGFTNVFIYSGGLFEWLCLQDIYGNDEFPCTSEELDILKYKASSAFSTKLLQ